MNKINLSGDHGPLDKNSIVDWEHSLSELEKIVKEFENEKLSLSDSLEKFERGVAIYKNCKSTLSEIESKIKILTESLKEEEYQPPSRNNEDGPR